MVIGKGNLAQWIIKFSDLYRLKTGMVLFPGSLNLRLESPYSLPQNVVRIEPGEGGCRPGVSIVPCKINDKDAFIVRTDNNESGKGDHPKTIVEVVCDVKLRDFFAVGDGDVVRLELLEDSE